MHGTESRFVIGPSDILFGGVYVNTFQPGNFTGCGSEGVNASILCTACSDNIPCRQIDMNSGTKKADSVMFSFPKHMLGKLRAFFVNASRDNNYPTPTN